MLSESEFEQLLAIYFESMPAYERKSEKLLRQMLNDPTYRFNASSISHKVVGFSIVKKLVGIDACLLEYLAVESSHRRQGLGQGLFGASLCQLMLIEAEAEVTTFYAKLGCLQITGLQYQMPAVAIAKPPSMNLRLFSANPPAAIPKQLLGQWLTAIYTEVYSQSPNDPAMKIMLASLPESIPLATLS